MALAVPAPLTPEELAERAQMVVLVELGEPKKTSWFWPWKQTWVVPITVQRCFQGCLLLPTSPELQLVVQPHAEGPAFTHLPEFKEAVLYADRVSGTQTLRPVSPPVHALAPADAGVIAALERLD